VKTNGNRSLDAARKGAGKVLRWAKLVGFGVVVVFVTLFVLRNEEAVSVDFIVVSVHIPLRGVILGSVGLGVAGTLLAIAFRNMPRKK